MPKDQVGSKETKPTVCYQCNAGPELLNVNVQDGIATDIEPHWESAGIHPGNGTVCVKAYGLIQKTYNPHRILTPMRRTNPKKGRDEDPGFEPISWEDALDDIGERLLKARENGARDDSGYPRVATTFGGGPTSIFYVGTLPSYLAAFGPADVSIGSGQGVKCAHSEHLYGEFWHRGFTVAPDTPNCDFLLSFGHNMDASGGVCSVIRHADARARGIKRVQIEPHMSVTGASSSEWVPIKPKTDPAFMFAMMNVMLHENPLERLDVDFLKHRTASPYLVAPNGFFLRNPESEKPLIWDLTKGAAVPHDTPNIDPALDGEFTLDGIEIGADEDRWEHQAVSCKPAHRRLADQVAAYTPEWAEGVCDVSAKTIRRITNAYLDHACIGETIEVEGETLPFRPVAIFLGKTVNNGWGGYECCWARTVLACLVGALEVPGGTLGTSVLINEFPRNRNLSVSPGADGFMDYPMNATDKENWMDSPDKRDAARMLVPLSGNSPRFKASGPGHMAWMTMEEGGLPNMPKMTMPDIWFVYRANPNISFWEVQKIENVSTQFPFTVCFAYTDDETNHMADILLPECTDLESMQLLRIGGTKFIEAFWDFEGVGLRQPVVDAPEGVRDFTWIATELAKRTGLLKEYNAILNKGATTSVPLKTGKYDFSLDVEKEHSRDEIWDAVCKAASMELTDGAEEGGLDYYQEHGFRVKKYPRKNWYLYPTMVEQNLRFELPYQERLMRIGTELGNRLHEKNITWWDAQLAEYKALPDWHDVPGMWEKAYEDTYDVKIGDYPFWLITSRSMQFAWGSNAAIPMIKEVADNIAGHSGIIMNAGRAKEMDIQNGDRVEISSPIGSVTGKAVLREGIRPDTLLMIGQFGHWKTPLAKDFDVPSMNSLVPMLMATTDNSGSSADIAKVSIVKIAEKEKGSVLERLFS